MGRTIQLWYQRNDTLTSVFYSPPIEASSFRDGTLFLNILKIGAFTVALSAEESSDPNDPNSWSAVGSSASGTAIGSFKGTVGGYTGGTTEPFGPYIRVKATLTATSGGVQWSGAIVLRD